MSHVVHVDKTVEPLTAEIYGGELATCAVDLVSTAAVVHDQPKILIDTYRLC